MPSLAEAGHTVIAPDLRGFGLSDKPLEGFDVMTVAEDIRQVVQHLGLDEVSLAGHDAGASVAYHWAASHPDEVRRLALMEAFPAGLEPPAGQAPTWKGKATWHLGFLSTPDLPEVLLANRESAFLTFLFRHAWDPATFSESEIEAYVKPFAALGGTRAALAHVRAMSRSAELNRKVAERKLRMPVLAIGGEISFGARMADAARQFAENVTGAVAERCGHWIPEERPAWLSGQLIAFFADTGSQIEISHQAVARG
jgi:pimeloyl-ACP methyl ester carboxylesterase